MRLLAICAAALAAACATAPADKQAWDVKAAARPPAAAAPVDERVAVLEAKCEARVAGSCFWLGKMAETGEGGVPRDLSRAWRRYGKACGLASAEACQRMEQLLHADDTTPPDLAPVEATFRDACNRGTTDACVGLSTMYVLGLHVPESPGEARKLLQRACDAKDGAACLRLGLVLQSLPAGDDVEAGLSLVERACALGNQLACVRSADRLLKIGYENRYYYSYGATNAALERLRTACRGGEYAGCVAYAQAYLEGVALPRDPAKGRELLKSSCDDGYARACEALALSLDEPAARGAEGLALWRRACDLRSGDACLRVARAQHPLPVPDGPAPAGGGELAPAVRLVQLSCTLHSPDGCATLGELHRRGLGVPRDPARASALGEKACRLGAESGCDRQHLARALRM